MLIATINVCDRTRGYLILVTFSVVFKLMGLHVSV